VSEDENGALSKQRLILSIAYALPQLLAAYCDDQMENLMHLNSMAQEKPDYSRKSLAGTAKYFRKCSNMRVVEPEVP
jgi:hypothetical protein